jgi:A/G-specific adenine glycosylase
MEALLAWGEAHRRDLPWRRTRDPWAILVSELMLQQTQVARVVPKWHAFLARFPDAATCAAAPVGDVVRMWDGLGYNRRAVRLHEAAVAVVERHGGVVPGDLTALEALPGIGPYTARAVLAFAFEADYGVVDVNAARVLARTAGRHLPPRAAQQRADELVPPGRAWAWNQAMLDLGATVCQARTARCTDCPVAASCAWHSTGGPDRWRAGPRQSTFDGSDRQGRGRIVAALRLGPTDRSAVPAVAGWPDDPERAHRALAGLVADGLVVVDDDRVRLP